MRTVLMILFVFIENPMAQAKADWVYYSGDDPGSCEHVCVSTFIDPFSKATYGFEKKGIRTLNVYSDEAQSAQTFGSSEVETVIFDCLNSRQISGGTTWYSGRMASGQVVHTDPAGFKWTPIAPASIKLFSSLCAP